MPYAYTTMTSLVGNLTLVASDKGLAAILWEHEKANRVPLQEMQEEPQNPLLQDTMRQLQEYFAGTRKSFSIPLDFQGTDFQKKVWNALLTIPYGETRSYADIANQVNRPKAVRAVGAANGKNPVSIIAPCHRVIGSNGDLTGFAGGLAAKTLLLSLEGHAEKQLSLI